MKTPYDKLGKIYTNCFGHMTIMADMPIYGKTPLKSSQEPEGPWPWDLVFSITDIGPTKFVKTMILGWPWPTLCQGQILWAIKVKVKTKKTDEHGKFFTL